MGRRQLCTYMYDVKSSSGVVTVAHGVRRGMGFVPFCFCSWVFGFVMFLVLVLVLVWGLFRFLGFLSFLGGLLWGF